MLTSRETKAWVGEEAEGNLVLGVRLRKEVVEDRPVCEAVEDGPFCERDTVFLGSIDDLNGDAILLTRSCAVVLDSFLFRLELRCLR